MHCWLPYANYVYGGIRILYYILCVHLLRTTNVRLKVTFSVKPKIRMVIVESF